VLAESMIEEFQDCFADVGGGETAIFLQDGSRNCVRGQRLADEIASATAK
jgi:hypothetical protein